jgi:hypothetical protein
MGKDWFPASPGTSGWRISSPLPTLLRRPHRGVRGLEASRSLALELSLQLWPAGAIERVIPRCHTHASRGARDSNSTMHIICMRGEKYAHDVQPRGYTKFICSIRAGYVKFIHVNEIYDIVT